MNIVRTIIVLALVAIIGGIITINTIVNQGGVKSIITEVGKGIKDISNDIDNYEPE